MPFYQYVVQDRAGNKNTGSIEAESEKAAAQKLKEQGFIISLRARPEAMAPIAAITRRATTQQQSPEQVNLKKKVGLKDLSIFARQFAVMINAGLPLLTCLNILTRQVSNLVLRGILIEVSKDVQGGSTLAAAIRKYPRAFPNLFASMIEAGELGGILDKTLEKTAVNYEKELDLNEKIIGAMVYPLVILGVAVLVVAALFIFVLPTFAKIFAEQNIELPLITRLLLGTSTLMVNYWYVLVGVIVGAVFAFGAYQQTPKGRRNIDNLILKTPLFGDLAMKASVARFCRIFATLFSSGVPLLQTLEVLKGLLDNVILAESVDTIQEGVKKGSGIAKPMMENGIFPIMVSQMMSIGEETGTIETVMEKVADFYEKEVEHAVKNLTSMMEPIIVVFLGAVVGLIVASIMMPMMQMTQAMGG